MPGRPGYDVVQSSAVRSCDQARCDGFRTGQLPFSGPIQQEQDCNIEEKSVAAPFLHYEDNRFFRLVSNRGDLLKFDVLLQLRERFGGARFPGGAEAVILREGMYFFAGNQELSVRQVSGNVIWRQAYGPPALWFSPLRINDQMVLVHGNIAKNAAARRMVPAAVTRLLQSSSGKTLLEIPLGGAYVPQRFHPLAALQGQKVVLSDPQGGLQAFSVTDLLRQKQRTVWTYRGTAGGAVLSLVGDPGASRVYAAWPGRRGMKNIAAFNTDTGALLWSTAMEEITTPIAFYKNMLIFGSRTGEILGLSASDGKVAMRAKPDLEMESDNEMDVVAVSEPVVDPSGRVYVAFAALPKALTPKLLSNRSMENETLDDVVEAVIVGVQVPSGRVMYKSSMFDVESLAWGKLFVGTESAGFFARGDRMVFCVVRPDHEH